MLPQDRLSLRAVSFFLAIHAVVAPGPYGGHGPVALDDGRGKANLGEGMGTRTGVAKTAEQRDAEKKKLLAMMKKAQEKMTKHIEAIAQRGDAQIAAQKRAMKERSEKATAARDESQRKAQELVDGAPAKWKAMYEKTAIETKRRWDALRERANKHVSELETKAIRTKQDRTSFWTTRINEARSQITELEERQKQWYLKQVTSFDKARSTKLAEARAQYREEEENLKSMMLSGNENMERQTADLKTKFHLAMKAAQKRKQDALEKLQKMEKEAIASAKSRVEKAKAKMEEEVAAAKDKGKAAQEKANEVLKESRAAQQTLTAEQNLLARFEAEYQKKLDAFRQQRDQSVGGIKSAMNSKLSKIEQKIDTTQDQASERVTKATQKVADKDAKTKEEQLTWIEKAQRNARQSCQDAKDTAELKASAAKFAAHRISRDAQSRMVMTKNHWLDAEEKARELTKKKDRQAEELKATTVDTAVAMAKNLYGNARAADSPPCEESFSMDSSDSNPSKIPEEGKLDRASEDFARAYIPVDSEKDVLHKRDVAKKKAYEVAQKKTWTWAHNHAVKVGEEAHAEAEKQCSESNKYFGEVETTANSRIGDVKDSKDSEKQKAEADAKKWADAQKQKLMAEKQDVTKSNEAKLAEIDKTEADQKAAIDADATKSMTEVKKNIAKYTARHAKLRSEGELALKLANEETTNRVDEATKIKAIEEQEALKIEQHAQARSREQALRIDADEQRDVDKLKQQLSTSVEQLKESSESAGAEGSFAARKEKAEKEKEDAESEAESQYREKVSHAKQKSDEIIRTDKGKTKQKISKFKLDLTQDTSKADEAVQKAIMKEKHEQQKIDGYKVEEKERREKSEANFMDKATDERHRMIAAAKQKERDDMAVARSKLKEGVDKATENAKQGIDQAKDTVLSSFENSPP